MYRHTIETLIPIVMEIMEEKERYYRQNGSQKGFEGCKFVKELKGHIASYGPSIIMAGLRQTVLAYNDHSPCVNEIVWETMQKMAWTEGAEDFQKLVERESNLQAKQRILDIIIASKLAVRTFSFEE